FQGVVATKQRKRWAWSQTWSLSYDIPGLHVPLRWPAGPEGTEGPVELEFCQPNLELHQIS
ncbi:hypothetical protein M9458_020305, partial [Cirrhinus mrigala]